MSAQPSKLSLAVIAGDGIGPEVCDQALRVLDQAAQTYGLTVETTAYPFSAAHYLDTGHVLDDADVQALRGHDAILLGAVGGVPNDPRLAGGVIEKGILLRLRFELDQYINLRPVKLYPGLETPLAGRRPGDIDMVVVRENTEGLYGGLGGVLRRGTPHAFATQDMTATARGTERCLRYAFELARARPRKHLTLVHKTNVLTHVGGLWSATFDQLKAEFEDVQTAYHHVDACCMVMVADPGRYDVVVTGNMFGDIITDLGAAIAGGMGIAASGNLDPTGAAPSMFEPVHGSAPDIAGQNKANPIATIDALAMLLTQTAAVKDDAAMAKAGQAVSAAVEATTPAFAGKSLDRSGMSTTQIGDLVLSKLC